MDCMIVDKNKSCDKVLGEILNNIKTINDEKKIFIKQIKKTKIKRKED